jgi:hypothetical protein
VVPTTAASGGTLVRWRKATWAIIIWTALCAFWLYDSVLNTQAESAERYGLFYFLIVGFSILFIWFVGLLVLTIVWLLSRPKQNTSIYGPQGQWTVVTEKEAKRRVEQEGWSYRPPPLYPPQPYPRQPYPQQHQGRPPPSGRPPKPPPVGPGQL